ncbi:hypothetical protein BST61_g4464 [Cercospora zeina]
MLQLAFPSQNAPTCISKPDHSNYGKNGDSWCRWDSVHFYKPAGVGCTTDAECQSLRFPYTNCKDSDSIAADSLAANGVMYRAYTNGQSGPTECALGVDAPPGHPGGQGSSGGGTQDVEEYCRDALSKSGFPDINVVAGCTIGSPPDRDVQCIYQCNGGRSCGPGADPKAYHKMVKGILSCPGYESAT